MSIEKLDYSTKVIEALQGAYRQDWCLTNWTGTGKPLLPAGMIISILGYPYLVSGGDETPADPAADGAVYLKITPDAPAGATATAVYVNSFTGTWSEAYNGWYDGSSLFLNVLMTKTGASWAGKGFWLDARMQKGKVYTDGSVDVAEDLTVGNDLDISGTTNATILNTSGLTTLSGKNIFSKGVTANIIKLVGVTHKAIYDVLSPLVPNIGDTIKLEGYVGPSNVTTTVYPCAYAERSHATRVKVYWRIGLSSKSTLDYDSVEFLNVDSYNVSLVAEY